VIIFVASEPIIKMNDRRSIGISGIARWKSFHSDGFEEAMGGGVDDDALASVSAELVLFFIFMIGLFDINIRMFVE